MPNVSMSDLQARVGQLKNSGALNSSDASVPIVATPGELASTSVPSTGTGEATVDTAAGREALKAAAVAVKAPVPGALEVKDGTIPFSPKQGNSKSTFVPGTGERFSLDTEAQSLTKMPPAIPLVPKDESPKPYAKKRKGA